jgi:hypothetical protein
MRYGFFVSFSGERSFLGEKSFFDIFSPFSICRKWHWETFQENDRSGGQSRWNPCRGGAGDSAAGKRPRWKKAIRKDE